MGQLNFGITITVSGNFKKALDDFEKGIGTSVPKVQTFKDKVDGLSNALANQATAFIAAGHGAFKLAGIFGSVFSGISSAIFNTLQAASTFQDQLLALKVFFGKDTDTLTGALLSIGNASNIAQDQIFAMAKRVGGLGLGVQETIRATHVLSQAISTLSGQDKTRALNGVANILQDANSAQQLLNIAFSESEKSSILAVKGMERQTAILGLLEKRFGNVNKIMSEGVAFNVTQLSQLFQLAFQQIALPVLNELLGPLREINLSFQEIFSDAEKSKAIFGPLQKAFMELINPLKAFLIFVAETDIVPKFFMFLSKNATLIKNLTRISFVLSGIAAALFAVAGAGLTAFGTLFGLKQAGIVLVSIASTIGNLINVLWGAVAAAAALTVPLWLIPAAILAGIGLGVYLGIKFQKQILAIQDAVVDFIVSWSKNVVNGFIDGLMFMWNGVKEFGVSIKNFFVSIGSWVMDGLRPVFQVIAEAIAIILDGMAAISNSDSLRKLAQEIRDASNPQSAIPTLVPQGSSLPISGPAFGGVSQSSSNLVPEKTSTDQMIHNILMMDSQIVYESQQKIMSNEVDANQGLPLGF